MGDLSKHFSRSEITCRCGCGFDQINMEIINRAEQARNHFGAAIRVNDGCRCESHNSAVGGVPHSQHTIGSALDIEVEGITPDEVASYFEHAYPEEGGVGRYDSFTHIDCRSNKARWDLRSKGAS